MVNPNARKGAQWETDLLGYLRAGGLMVERLPKTGREDECDLVVMGGLYARGNRYEVIEAKNVERIALPQWLRERDTGVANFAKHRALNVGDVSGVVVVKRRGSGVGNAFVVTTVDDYYAIHTGKGPQ